jgi:hypothetical protein
MSNNSARGTSYSLSAILGIVFVVLKLTGNIGWSWWWVTAPFWFVPAIIISLWLLAVILDEIW